MVWHVRDRASVVEEELSLAEGSIDPEVDTPYDPSTSSSTTVLDLFPETLAARPRLVFNALPLDPRGGGVSTYIRELLAAMVPVVGADLVAAVRPAGVQELPGRGHPAGAARFDGVRRAIEGARGFGPADLTHGLDVDLPYRGTGPRVATVHDLAVFDVPWAFPRYRVAGERILVRAALRRADAVVAVSDFTAERVRAITGREAVVVHEAPSPAMVPAGVDEIARVRQHYGLPEQFVLHVGNIEPRKDLRTLATACLRLAVPLVLTGHELWSSRAPESVIGDRPRAGQGTRRPLRGGHPGGLRVPLRGLRPAAGRGHGVRCRGGLDAGPGRGRGGR